jgi:hypothetical protein
MKKFDKDDMNFKSTHIDSILESMIIQQGLEDAEGGNFIGIKLQLVPTLEVQRMAYENGSKVPPSNTDHPDHADGGLVTMVNGDHLVLAAMLRIAFNQDHSLYALISSVVHAYEMSNGIELDRESIISETDHVLNGVDDTPDTEVPSTYNLLKSFLRDIGLSDNDTTDDN